MSTISLVDSRNVLNEITATQAKRMAGLYDSTLKTVQKQMKTLSKDTSATGALQKVRLKALEKELKSNITAVSKKMGGIITEGMGTVAGAVVKDNVGWAAKMGLKTTGMLASVPQDVVTSITYGKVYDKDWSLSQAIWANDNKIKRDINDVIARGVAQNKSAFDIGKDLEKYVDPKAAKDWQWNKVYPGTASHIDYNAQRLSRTMVTHAYEQSLVSSVKDNPFCTGIEWQSGHSDRTCPICSDRDGVVYEKDKLPVDHPNGMCTWIPVIPENDDAIINRISKWYENGDDAELDKYAGKFGYQGEKPTINKIKSTINEIKPTINKIKPTINEIKSTINEAKPAIDISKKQLSLGSEGKTYTIKDVAGFAQDEKQYALSFYQQQLGLTDRAIYEMSTSELDSAIERMFITVGKDSAKEAAESIKYIRTLVSKGDGSASQWREVVLDDVKGFTERQKEDFLVKYFKENGVTLDWKTLRLIDKDELAGRIFNSIDVKEMKAVARELNQKLKSALEEKAKVYMQTLDIDNATSTKLLNGKVEKSILKEMDVKYSKLPESLRKLESVSTTDARSYARLKEVRIDDLGHYTSYEKQIGFNLKKDMSQMALGFKNQKYGTYFHEYGHYLDDMAGDLSSKPEFLSAIQKDYDIMMKKYTVGDLQKSLNGIETNMSKGIQDTISGMSDNKIRLKYGHSTEYWNNKGANYRVERVGSETFASITSAYTDPEVLRFYKQYFPSVLDAYDKVIAKALKDRIDVEVLLAWK